MAAYIEDRMSDENNTPVDDVSSKNKRSQSFRTNSGLVILLPSLTKIPRISITLYPKEHITNANSAVISDALRRSNAFLLEWSYFIRG